METWSCWKNCSTQTLFSAASEKHSLFGCHFSKQGSPTGRQLQLDLLLLPSSQCCSSLSQEADSDAVYESVSQGSSELEFLSDSPESPSDGDLDSDSSLPPGRPAAPSPHTPDIEPDTPEVEPDKPKVEPDTPEIEPDTPDIEPHTPKVEPDTPDIEPDTPDVDLESEPAPQLEPDPSPQLEPDPTPQPEPDATKQLSAEPDVSTPHTEAEVSPKTPSLTPDAEEFEPSRADAGQDALNDIPAERPEEPSDPNQPGDVGFDIAQQPEVPGSHAESLKPEDTKVTKPDEPLSAGSEDLESNIPKREHSDLETSEAGIQPGPVRAHASPEVTPAPTREAEDVEAQSQTKDPDVISETPDQTSPQPSKLDTDAQGDVPPKSRDSPPAAPREESDESDSSDDSSSDGYEKPVRWAPSAQSASSGSQVLSDRETDTVSTSVKEPSDTSIPDSYWSDQIQPVATFSPRGEENISEQPTMDSPRSEEMDFRARTPSTSDSDSLSPRDVSKNATPPVRSYPSSAVSTPSPLSPHRSTPEQATPTAASPDLSGSSLPYEFMPRITSSVKSEPYEGSSHDPRSSDSDSDLDSPQQFPTKLTPSGSPKVKKYPTVSHVDVIGDVLVDSQNSPDSLTPAASPKSREETVDDEDEDKTLTDRSFPSDRSPSQPSVGSSEMLSVSVIEDVVEPDRPVAATFTPSSRRRSTATHSPTTSPIHGTTGQDNTKLLSTPTGTPPQAQTPPSVSTVDSETFNVGSTADNTLDLLDPMHVVDDSTLQPNTAHSGEQHRPRDAPSEPRAVTVVDDVMETVRLAPSDVSCASETESESREATDESSSRSTSRQTSQDDDSMDLVAITEVGNVHVAHSMCANVNTHFAQMVQSHTSTFGHVSAASKLKPEVSKVWTVGLN